MAAYTVFNRVQAQEFKGPLTGNVTGDLTGALKGAVTGVSSAVDVTLTAAQKAAPFIGVTLTAASKVVTLGLAAGQTLLVHNAGGTNAFTLKNVSGDSGTSLAAGKLALVVGSDTANASTVLVLN